MGSNNKREKQEKREDQKSLSDLGTIVSVRSSIVDVEFKKSLPPIYSLLHTGKDRKVAIEVLSQLDSLHVRGIALTPTEGLFWGMMVEYTEGPLKVPVGKETLSRMFNVFENPIDREAAPSDVQWRSIHQDLPPLIR